MRSSWSVAVLALYAVTVCALVAAFASVLVPSLVIVGPVPVLLLVGLPLVPVWTRSDSARASSHRSRSSRPHSSRSSPSAHMPDSVGARSPGTPSKRSRSD
jgi:fatty acid desaturase